MEDKQTAGTSFLMVIQLILLAIKVNGVGSIAALSWGIILIPVWIWLALFLIVLVLYVVIK